MPHRVRLGYSDSWYRLVALGVNDILPVLMGGFADYTEVRCLVRAVHDAIASRDLEQETPTGVLAGSAVVMAKEVNMMQRNARRFCVGFVFILLAGTVWGQAPQRSRADKRADARVRTVRPHKLPALQRAVNGPRAIPRNVDTATPTPEGVTAAGVGTIVYSNLISDRNTFYPPGVNQRMADDVTLASGACSLVEYTFDVFSDSPTVSFSVTAEVFDDDPCLTRTANLIAGSTLTFPNLQAGLLHSLTVTLPAPAAVPGTIWIALTFTDAEAGWVVGELAEIGSTLDLWSEDEKDEIHDCVLLGFAPPNPPWAGFVASVTCDISEPPPGACCSGQTCSETTETNCVGGAWQGAFTTCDPSPCLLGACCTGADFGTCADTTEAGCVLSTGLFHPGALCSSGVCQPSFEVYTNQVETNIFSTISVAGTSWADDWELGPGAPGVLVAYELTVVGAGASYDVTTRLWTNDPGTDPLDPLDDLPGTIIAGTEQTFTNLPGEFSASTIVAGPFTGIELPVKVWVELSTTATDAGPLMAGFPNPGNSVDGFAVFNDSLNPDVWSGLFNIGGYTPDDCPGVNCVPAGSFTGRLWLVGDDPIGACCNDGAGTCVEGITRSLCDGRWAQDLTCTTANFDPPCGNSACCTQFGCGNFPAEECALLGGSVIEGQFCASQDDPLCPDIACRGASGDCLANNGSPGCEDAICCDTVCLADPNCCDPAIGWDDSCALAAASLCTIAPPNDHCRDATEIQGAGEFDFDNSNATTDGELHPSCSTVDGADQLTSDVWFCWTADVTGPVTIQTCGLTTVDTRVAVYLGCGNCPTPELSLLQCNDDFCGFELLGLQSQVTFDAVAGENYSIRVGTFPGGESFPRAPGGPGQIRITNGTPVNPNCGGVDDCCSEATGPGCGNVGCCNEVCLRDPFCCEVTWDANCAGTGEFGAGTVCGGLCGQGICPDGSFVFDQDGFVDRRQPYPVGAPGTRQGLTEITVSTPAGAGNPVCWTLCETAIDGSPNEIFNVVDNFDGTFTIQLTRAISTNAATTITYTPDSGSAKTGTYTSHLANADLTGIADRGDVITVLRCVTGAITCADHQGDLNRTGLTTSIDALQAIDMLNGGGGYPATLNTQIPSAGPSCP